MLRMLSANISSVCRRIDDGPQPALCKQEARIYANPVVVLSASPAEPKPESGGKRRGARPPMARRTIGRVIRILRKAAPGWNAPVLTLMAAERRDPFLTLIGCVLSLRTKDQATAVAAPRLFERADTPSRMLEVPPSEIERL